MGSMDKKVRSLMIEAGLNQKQLSELMGISSTNFYSKLRRDSFTEEELEKIAIICKATYKRCFIMNENGKEI